MHALIEAVIVRIEISHCSIDIDKRVKNSRPSCDNLLSCVAFVSMVPPNQKENYDQNYI